MPEKIVKKTIADLAEVLKMKGKNNQSMVLLLGSRAGGLFRSPTFFERMREYSKRNFDLLSREGQFAESYKLLQQDLFNDRDIHEMLKVSLQQVTITDSDIYLAEFVKQGLFDVIISTNIDTILEHAFEYVGMREPYDFDVFIPERASSQDFITDKNFITDIKICKFIKLFGDVSSHMYNVTRRSFFLDSLQDSKASLETILARDVLVIGFDPIWDAEVLRAFNAQESSLWLVTEEEATIRQPAISRVLRRKRTRYIAGRTGSYEQFLKALYWHLYERMPMYHQLISETNSSLHSLHNKINLLGVLYSEVQAVHKEILGLQEKLNRCSDKSGQQ